MGVPQVLRAPGGPSDYLYAQARIPPLLKYLNFGISMDLLNPSDIQEVTLAISSTYGRELPLRKGWLEIEGILMPTLEKVWTGGLMQKKPSSKLSPA